MVRRARDTACWPALPPTVAATPRGGHRRRRAGCRAAADKGGEATR